MTVLPELAVLQREAWGDSKKKAGIPMENSNNNKMELVLQIRKRLEEAAPEVIEDMINTLHAPATPAAVKVRIYEIMLDRLMGKPEATIRLEDPAGALEEAENMIAAIAEGIRKDVKP